MADTATPPLAANTNSLTYALKVYANCDHVLIAWQPSQPIPQCLGFALYRRRNAGIASATDEVLDTWLGFDSKPLPPGTHKPSTTWPIQRLLWSDYLVQQGDQVSYRLIPVVGPDPVHLTPRHDLGSDWTAPVSVVPGPDGAPMEAYFNRGVLAAQWVTRLLEQEGGGETPSTTLAAALDRPNDPLRRRLAGPLRGGLLALLDAAIAGGQQVHAALFELDDEELLDRLHQFGSRAHIVLANGSPSKTKPDENVESRAQLKAAGCEVLDRMLPSGHLGHNKFLVVSAADGTPNSAWTGSTNWTKTGLCTQVNNGLLLKDSQIAATFKAQWSQLAAAGNAQPTSLQSADSQPHKVTLDGGRQVTIWFAPNTIHGGVYGDLAAARQTIATAQNGILFLMFMPGTSGTLLEDIMARAGAEPDLYVRGVLNQDPHLQRQPHAGVALFHRNEWHVTNMDVVLPTAIPTAFAAWQKELLKLPTAHAMVHSKVIIVDAFGEHPVVITGSHNMGPKASRANDENLVIIEGDSALAAAYAVNVLAVYNDYSWRYHSVPDKTVPATTAPLSQHAGADDSRALAAGAQPAAKRAWKSLSDTDTWQDVYFHDGPDSREMTFWLGDK